MEPKEQRAQDAVTCNALDWDFVPMCESPNHRVAVRASDLSVTPCGCTDGYGCSDHVAEVKTILSKTASSVCLICGAWMPSSAVKFRKVNTPELPK